MEFVEHEGRDTPVRRVGPDSGAPLALYVHGSGGTHRVWSHQYGPDRPVERTAAIDLSGHGQARASMQKTRWTPPSRTW
jgi:pimeloyl-ACP methyl ester carboxylesterase